MAAPREHQAVWIVGASSGIGEALAYAYGQQGARLLLSSRRPEALGRVANDPRVAGSPVDILPLDLTALETLPAVARRAIDRWGRLDVLVLSSGISQRAAARDTLVSVDQQLMLTNYLGPVALTKAVLPILVQQRQGQIVVISSVAGKFGVPSRSGYAASKHALHGFFDSLRAEVAAEGIHILLVCPGYVRTQISLHALRGDGTAHGQVDQAIERGMAPEACAQAILRAVRRQRQEIYPGGLETYGVYVKRLFPRLFARLLAQYARPRSGEPRRRGEGDQVV